MDGDQHGKGETSEKESSGQGTLGRSKDDEG